jgi:hypothetical protein
MATYILHAASAAAYGFNTEREVARSADRSELEALKSELDAADTAAGRYSTVHYIDTEKTR